MQELLEHRLDYWLAKNAQARKDPAYKDFESFAFKQAVMAAGIVMELQYILHRQFGRDFDMAFDECPCSQCRTAFDK